MGWGGEGRGAQNSQLGEACPGPLQGPREVQLGYWQVLSGVGSGQHARGRGQAAGIAQGTEQNCSLQSGPCSGSPSSD